MQKPSQRDDTQKKLLDFVNDPDNIKKAAEGSMEKRNKVMDSQRDKANLDSPSTSRVQVEVRDSQRDEAIKHKVWVVAATFIGADDEDHEDDEVIQPLYDAIMHLILLDRSQRHKEILDDLRDEAMHYQRVCRHCGYQWFGLHCPHDGYQNPCPKCTRMPAYMSRQAAANCNCELVLPASDITSQLEALRETK